MATCDVPHDFSSIAAAAAAASPGDVIIVAAVYAGNEAAIVTVDNLTIDAPASVPDIANAVDATVNTLILTGDAAIRVFADTNNNVLNGNLEANSTGDFGGNDRIDGGGAMIRSSTPPDGRAARRCWRRCRLGLIGRRQCGHPAVELVPSSTRGMRS